jgi:hypothetical protein
LRSAAAVAEFGARAARLNHRNADPEGCNFLRAQHQRPVAHPMAAARPIQIFIFSFSVVIFLCAYHH